MSDSLSGPTVSRRDVLEATAGLGGMAVFGGTVAGDEHEPPEFDDIDVIRESVWVETGTDTDDSGRSDRVHVDIARPASTADEPLPVLVRPDPYDIPDEDRVGNPQFPPTGLSDPYNTMEVDLYRPGEDRSSASQSTGGPDARQRARTSVIPGDHRSRAHFHEEKLLPEGYVFAYASPIGTGLSTGCSTTGGPAEVQSIEAVVDWLNGRATAYDSRGGTTTVGSDWTTGDTALFGGSYRGTLANAVAARGVDGVETIVPIRAISSWYTYVRSNGAVIMPGAGEEPSAAGHLGYLTANVTNRRGGDRCESVIEDLVSQLDRDSGNYNDFWAARDYVPDADQVEGSVLLVHGLYDRQVRPTEFAQWLDALQTNDVPYRVWVHQGGHDKPRKQFPEPWIALLRRWLAYWLKGEENGVMDEPAAIVEREDGSRNAEADWPAPESQATSVRFQSGGESTGGLGLAGPTESVTEQFVDNSEIPPTSFLEDDNTDHRLAYRSDALTDSLRVSGTPEFDLALSFDSPAALVSVALVDYGPDGAEIVNRGWANPQNRNSVRESDPIEPGQQYTISFPMEPVDYVFEEGHRLGVVVYSSDYNVTKRPPSSPELTLELAESSVELPIVDGESALTAAVPDSSTVDTDDGTDNNDDQTDETGDEDSDEDQNGTEATADGDGPGLGVGSALAGLGGLGYLLKRRR